MANGLRISHDGANHEGLLVGSGWGLPTAIMERMEGMEKEWNPPSDE
jgi:hypothetical protein